MALSILLFRFVRLKKQEAKTDRNSKMSTKSQDKKKNKYCARQWTKEEVEKFVEVLPEP